MQYHRSNKGIGPVPITTEQQAHANKLLAVWIALSLRPFSIIEDSGLAAYVRYICEVHMSCVAHLLHLVVGGTLIKWKSKSKEAANQSMISQTTTDQLAATRFGALPSANMTTGSIQVNVDSMHVEAEYINGFDENR
ncbi:hypothetical protein PHMEG_00017824 [Phytophthora megakarya]|uniref:Uncharacterized protein n=1 Tax=Phytophthora megakarya TaxID=4795 RepID=A0A225VVV7_9STRA|nr:hypothetical protein PHMEG_00017824 [Phytophthora megakarya]